MKYFISLTVLLVISCDQGSGESEYWSGKCLKKDTRYAVADQCDAYVDCKDGVPEYNYCPDGLLFNDDSPDPENRNCQYPNEVTCAGRTKLQPAQPTLICPHQFVYLRLGGPDHCSEFLNCAAGHGVRMNCTVGKAFNSKTYQCDWPDQVPDCDAEAYLQFQCPKEARSGAGFYRSNKCEHYFSCVNGRPRLHECPPGEAFSDEHQKCLSAEKVPGCGNK